MYHLPNLLRRITLVISLVCMNLLDSFSVYVSFGVMLMREIFETFPVSTYGVVVQFDLNGP
jgi:hypothetical protein